MEKKGSITVVYHPMCKASTDFIIKVSELGNYDKEFINLKEDKIESSEIDVDVVPLIIIDNDHDKIYRGKLAFDMLTKLKEDEMMPPLKTNSSMKYNTNVTFIEQTDNKKERIDLEKK